MIKRPRRVRTKKPAYNWFTPSYYLHFNSNLPYEVEELSGAEKASIESKYQIMPKSLTPGEATKKESDLFHEVCEIRMQRLAKEERLAAYLDLKLKFAALMISTYGGRFAKQKDDSSIIAIIDNEVGEYLYLEIGTLQRADSGILDDLSQMHNYIFNCQYCK